MLDYNPTIPTTVFALMAPRRATASNGHDWYCILKPRGSKPGCSTPNWLVTDAQRLFENACRHGWDVDGAPGIVYTLDWGNRPVVRHRLHWTHAEASAAASALLKRTREEQYEDWYRRSGNSAKPISSTGADGSWHHELDPLNRPSADIWAGKPDLYHAWQATLMPGLPLAPSLARALAKVSQSGSM